MDLDVATLQQTFSERQLDALRELANIGCGHAATALSKLLGAPKMGIDIPKARVAELAEVALLVGGDRRPVVAVSTEVSGGLRGRLCLLMPLADAQCLAGLLLGEAAPTGALAEVERSAVTEAGNIVGAACLTALARAMGLHLMPSVPRYCEGTTAEVLREVVTLIPELGDRAIVLETRFASVGLPEISGHFFILPEMPSLPRMLQALGV